MIKTKVTNKETCQFCGHEYDLRKHDNSGYLYDKPICEVCVEDTRDYLDFLSNRKELKS